MTIYIEDTLGFVRFQGFLTPYLSYKMKLKNRFSNEYMVNGGEIYNQDDWFHLTVVDNYETWHSFQWQFNNILVFKEAPGYYDCEIYANDGGDDVLISTSLCKVNSYEESYREYISDNEQDSQYIYYR